MTTHTITTGPLADIAAAVPGGTPTVYANGNPDAYDPTRPLLTVAGSRASTSYGNTITAELTTYAVDNGFTIVTNGGHGIAETALKAALAAGGKPVVWLSGSTTGRVYPSVHTGLFERVIEAGGVLLSLHPNDSTPTRFGFLQTAQVIGRISDATLLVEAGPRSGSLLTAAAALEAGKRVAVVPGPITSTASAGSNALLSDPRVTAAHSLASVLELAPHTPHLPASTRTDGA